MDNPLLIIVAFFAISIIFLMIFSKQIRIFLIRIKYGKYSFRYVNQFKKYANKNPFPYCIKDEILSYLKLNSYIKEESTSFVSDKTVHFDEISTNLPINSMIDRYGKPHCFNAFLIKDQEFRVYGYYKEMFEVEVKAAFFFFDGFFVMGEYIIENSAKIDIDKLTIAIRLHYGINDDRKTSKFEIHGKDDTSLLFFDNGFSAIIRYLNQAKSDFIT